MNRFSSFFLPPFRRIKKNYFLIPLLLFKAFAFSTSYTWVNPLASTWNTNANWTPNTGFPNGVADVANFGNVITGNRTVTLGAPITVNRINFDSSFGYTIAGGANSLTLQASSGNALIGITHNNGNGLDSISSNIILNSPISISHDSTSLFTLSGVISGNQSLAKTGVGTTVLSGANLYSGGTFINQGTLRIANSGNLGSGDITFTGTSTLAITSAGTITKNITFNNGIGAISPTSPVTLSGQITGIGTIAITNGTVVLTNTTNNYTGNTIFGATVSGTGGNGILEISNPLQLGATSGIVAWGGSVGTLHITDDMTIANLPLTISGGNGGIFFNVDAGKTLTYSGNINSVSGGVFSVRNGGGTTILTGNNLNYTQPMIVQAVSGIQSTLIVSDVINLGALNTPTRIAGGVLGFSSSVINPSVKRFDISAVGTVGGFFQPTIINDLGTNNEIQGVIQRTVGSGSLPILTIIGPGALTISNPANTFEWGVLVNTNGTLKIPSNGALGLDVSTNPLTLDSGTLEFLQSGGGVTSLLRPLNLNGSGSGTWIIDDTTTNEWGGAISGNQNLLITKPTGGLGTGVLKLSGNNSPYSGNITLDDVTLQITNGNNLGTGSLILNSGLLELVTGTTETLTAAIALNGVNNTLQLDAGTDWILDGVISGGAANPLIFTGTGRVVLDNTNTYSGATILNGATLGLANGSSIGTGQLTLTSGVLEFVSGTETLNNAISLNGPSAIQSDAGTDWTLDGAISGGAANPLTFTGTGRIVLNHANTYAGGTTLNGPTLALRNGSAVGTGPLNLNSGLLELSNGVQSLHNPILLNGAGVIQADLGADWTLNGGISDGGTPSPLRLTGFGRVTLNAINTYSQGTYLDGGILRIFDNANLGNVASTVTFNSGVLELAASVSMNRPLIFTTDASILTTAGFSHFDGPLTGPGGLIKGGVGGLSINGPASYTGNTLVALGTLFVNSDISSSPLTTLNLGAVLGGNGVLALVDAFGTISPGNSIGTLTVNQLTFEPQSTYFVEVMGSSADSIIAQDTITILPGSNLVVNPVNIQQGDYTIATATNGINGTFTTVLNQGVRYEFDVFYPGNEIVLHFLNMVPFANFFCGGNLKHITECWDYFVDSWTPLVDVAPIANRLQLTASPEMNQALAVLNSLSITELVNAFNQLDPGIYQSVTLAELDAANGLLDFYENHTHNDWDFPFIPYQSCDLNNKEFSFWIAPYGLVTERSGNHRLRAESSFHNKESTIASGMDFRPLEDLSMTAGVAYSYNDVHWSHANARSSFQSYSAIIGSSYVRSSVALDACIAATYNSGKGKRRIFIKASPFSPKLIDPIDYTLKNNNQACTIASRLGIKCNLYTATLCDSVLCSIWPFANVDYTFLHQYGYKETGGGIFDLKVHGRNADLLKPEAGIGITLVNPTCDIQYFTDASLAFGREYRTMGRSLKANFKQSPGCSFKVKGLYPQGCFAIPRVSIGARSLIHSIDLSLSYNGAFGSSIKKNELTAQINIGF